MRRREDRIKDQPVEAGASGGGAADGEGEGEGDGGGGGAPEAARPAKQAFRQNTAVRIKTLRNVESSHAFQ